MRPTIEPLLEIQRDCLKVPDGDTRFAAYLNKMIDYGDLALPLPQFNPMAREQVTTALDQLIGIQAETLMANEAHNFVALTRESLAAVKLALVVADSQGKWTNRHTTDWNLRFTVTGESRRGWLLVVWWANDPTSATAVRSAARTAIYRHHLQMHQGMPNTLAEMLRQEGLALAFAGSKVSLSPEQIDEAAKTIRNYMDSEHFPHQVACLYGDEAAVSLGYSPLGLPPMAGFELALARALESGVEPLTITATRAALELIS